LADDDVRVPAGWYPDPLGLPQLRWWDNHAWTEHTSDARQPMVAQENNVAGTRLAYADDDEDEALNGYVIDYDGSPLGDGLEDTISLTRRERRDRERTDTSGIEVQTAGDGAMITTPDEPVLADPLLSLEAPVRDEVSVEEPSPAMRLSDTLPADDAPTSAPFQLDTRFDDLLGEPTLPRSAFAHVSESATNFVPEATPQGPYAGFETAADYMAARAARTAAATAPAATAVEERDPHHHLRVGNGPVWIIALVPLLVLVLGLLFLLSGLAGKASPIFITLVAVIPYLATVGLAVADRSMLKKAGFKHTAHWAWAFLTAPTYLITRLAAVVRETGRGFGPLLTWGAFAVLLLGSLVAVPGLIIAMAPGSFSYAAQQSVRQDAQILGATLQVDCPDIPPTLIGDTFTCAAINQDGQFFNVKVSLQRANGWIEWRVDDWGIYSMTS